MKSSKLVFLPAALGCAALIVGCSVTANLTVPASTVATQAEQALEQQVGGEATMDCGTGDVDLVDGTTVDCILTDETTGSSFDTVVTIRDVNGTNFRIEAEVSEQAR